jgi:tetratricopeptide (TPR) repeat protein
VFLARQPALADRPVVLKLTPGAGREHLALSRLQHTHIVPLYSAHIFPERKLRGLCQPYFGGAALAAVLRLIEAIPPGRRTGLDLLRALERASAAGTATAPACQFLARASFVQAVCWLGACLADALQYAHERGLLHLDLKPSNVLLAADGQPMLLDFHLARAPLAAGAPAPAGLGGTPCYMAPEHQAALAAVAGRHDVPAAVDGRADVFALGVLLYGALGGTVPVPAERTGEALRRRNPCVPRGLANLLSRSLAADPAARYASAGDLAADLRRHLADLPLRGVPDRSPAERWRKWRRRRPYALPLLGLLLTCLVACGSLFVHALRQTRAAEAAWQQGQDYLRRQRYAEARDAFKSGAALTEDLSLDAGLRRRLAEGIERAERGRAADELHLLCERVRPLYGADLLPAAQARAVADHCRRLWDERQSIARCFGESSARELEQQSRADLLDLAILWASLRVRLAPPGEAHLARQEALNVLAQAEALFGPSCVLDHERRAHALALGRADLAEAARQGAAPAPRSAWEHYALGRAYLQADDLARACEELDRALDLQPGGLWQNFSKGVCAYRMGQYPDALAAFSACTALAPQSASCFHNRGRVYAELGRLDRALQDYDRALQLDPQLAAAALGRADVYRRLERYDDALADLERARRGGIDEAVISYQQAIVYLGRQDKAAAVTRLRDVLRLQPGHERARELLAQLQPPQ